MGTHQVARLEERLEAAIAGEDDDHERGRDGEPHRLVRVGLRPGQQQGDQDHA